MVYVKLLQYRIGHPSYGGANRPETWSNPHRVVMALIDRGVAARDARAAVNKAAEYPYPHVTMYNYAGAVIELTAREE